MKKKSSIYLDILSHVLLVGATIVAIFPLVWIIISSVKGKGELTQYPTRFWPEQFTLVISLMLSTICTSLITFETV
ncbi:ABC transporter permease SP1688 [Streptococcus pneumoniae]|nr:ABC transporter permease SP1688 [Streptococcus pneumoniae]